MDQGFNRAILTIAHPALESERRGFGGERPAKTDATRPSISSWRGQFLTRHRLSVVIDRCSGSARRDEECPASTAAASAATAGNRDVDGDDIGDAAAGRVALAKDPAGATAVADGNDDARLGGIVGIADGGPMFLATGPVTSSRSATRLAANLMPIASRL